MRHYRLGYFILLLAALGSCKTAVVSTSSTETYREDLNGLRPDLTIIQKETDSSTKTVASNDFSSTTDLSLTTELDSINKIIIQRNSEKKFVDGYTIQVYTGNDNDAAYEAKDHVMNMFPELEPVISYNQPTFKVKVGSYHNRLEAHKVYESLKQDFPYALLIPERIAIKYE